MEYGVGLWTTQLDFRGCGMEDVVVLPNTLAGEIEATESYKDDGEDVWRYDPNVGAELDPSLVPGARVVIVKGKLCVGVEGIVLGVATGDEMSMVCESRFEDSFGVLLKEQDGSVTILLPGDQYRVLPDPQQ